MAAEIAVRNGAIEVGKVVKLFGGVPADNAYLYDVSVDGQKFIVALDGSPTPTSAAAPPLTMIENWPAKLR